VTQPDYDFFVRPGERGGGQGGVPAQQFGGPAAQPGAPTNQFGPPTDQFGSPPNQFGPPPPTQVGARANQFGTPVAAPPGWQAAPAARRGGLPGWAIGLIVGAAGLVVLSILAAVAVPVFLNQRAKAVYQATTMQFPGAVDGLTRNAADPTAERLAAAVQRQADAQQGLFVMRGAAYGDATSGSIDYVITGHATRSLTMLEQTSIRLGMVNASGKQGAALTTEPPGRLGGDFRCAATGQKGTMCFATDPAGIVVIVIVGGDQAGQVDRARQIREAVELRS
jgi:hypothetical protein